MWKCLDNSWRKLSPLLFSAWERQWHWISRHWSKNWTTTAAISPSKVLVIKSDIEFVQTLKQKLNRNSFVWPQRHRGANSFCIMLIFKRSWDWKAVCPWKAVLTTHKTSNGWMQRYLTIHSISAEHCAQITFWVFKNRKLTENASEMLWKCGMLCHNKRQCFVHFSSSTFIHLQKEHGDTAVAECRAQQPSPQPFDILSQQAQGLQLTTSCLFFYWSAASYGWAPLVDWGIEKWPQGKLKCTPASTHSQMLLTMPPSALICYESK
mgnify:CR=1 FL=1